MRTGRDLSVHNARRGQARGPGSTELTTHRPRIDHATTTQRPRNDHATTTHRPRIDHASTTHRCTAVLLFCPRQVRGRKRPRAADGRPPQPQVGATKAQSGFNSGSVLSRSQPLNVRTRINTDNVVDFVSTTPQARWLPHRKLRRCAQRSLACERRIHA